MIRTLALHLSRHTSRRTFFHAVMAASALVALLPGRPAHADTLANIQKAGVIRVAIPNDFPPFGSLGPDLKLQGYDIDMAGLIAKELGVKAELVPVTSTNRIPFLTTGKVDVVISSLGKNAERAKVIDFSQAYAPYYLAVFGPKNLNVKSASDLAGKTVAVARGTLEDLSVTKVAPPSATIKRFDDPNGAIAAFLSGQAQLLVVGNDVGATIIARHPSIDPEQKFSLFSSPDHVGLNKNEPRLMEKVNGAIAGAKKNGSLNGISQKWLRASLPADL